MSEPAQRVSSIPFPDQFRLPGKPQDAPSSVQDAHRQTTFVLGRDLTLFEESMNLQLRIVDGASASSNRTHPYAALMGFWSRTFLALSDTCLLATRGSYPSCLALVRTASELIAAQVQLQREMDVYLEWLAEHLVPNVEHKAFDFGLGRYFAAEPLASDERLRSVYRASAELGRPYFGSTLLQQGPESNNRRLALHFADASFHVGWAEVVIGWLLALSERQLAAAVSTRGIFPIADDTRAATSDLAGRIDEALARPDRCSIEEIADGHARRYLVHNFRRAPGAAPKKVLL